MKANAPEKLYISSIKKRDTEKCYSATIVKYVDDDIEYIRTDAFIEKACDAYCKACNKPSYSVPIPFCRRRCESYNNFIKNIKL